MGIWNKQPPEAADPIRQAANDKVAAAVRLSKALSEAGAAFDNLFEADRAYLGAYRQEHGGAAYSSSLLMNRFRGMLLCELELSAPGMLKYLDQPRQSLARCHTIATNIARQVDNDLSSLPQSKEPTQ